MRIKTKFYQDKYKDQNAYGSIITFEDNMVQQLEELFRADPPSLWRQEYKLNGNGAFAFQRNTYGGSIWSGCDTLDFWLNPHDGNLNYEKDGERYFARTPEARITIRKEPGLKIMKPGIFERICGERTKKEPVFRYRREKESTKSSYFDQCWRADTLYVPGTLLLIGADNPVYIELCKMTGIEPRNPKECDTAKRYYNLLEILRR